MREPPRDVDPSDVLDVARRTWRADLDGLSYLPVGFGAHHWQATAGDRPVLFVTLDAIDARHDATELHDAYATAATLRADGLEFVHANVLPLCVPFGDGVLSATPWLDGVTPDRVDVAITADLLSRLHAATAPVSIPRWRPLVPVHYAATLRPRLSRVWDRGPWGERARATLADRIEAIGRWTARYHDLAVEARRRPWVVTHGEPHESNQLLTEIGPLLVDWESVKLAPAERDLRVLVDEAGAELVPAHPPMLELFDLEWRLDEIRQYADWFEAVHHDDESDRIALADLEEELTRDEWSG